MMYYKHLEVKATKHYTQRIIQRNISYDYSIHMLKKLDRNTLYKVKDTDLFILVRDIYNKIAIVIRVVNNTIKLITAMFIYNNAPTYGNNIVIDI